MFGKDLYRYDTKKLSYVKEKKGLAFWARVYGPYALFFLVALAGFSLLYFQLYDSPRVKTIKREHVVLVQTLDSLDMQQKQLLAQLDILKTKDRALYKTILNADPIEEKLEDDLEGAAPDLNLDDMYGRAEKLDSKLAESEKRESAMLEQASKNKKELERIPAIRPVKGDIISGFGKRKNPITKKDKMHPGIDFKADIGTPVVATGDGVVQEAGSKNNGRGQYISVNHSFGYVSVYAHLSRVTVQRGQKVKRGQVIGYSGNSGLTKGPHLYYEVQKNGTAIDPIDYFYTDLSPQEYKRFKEKAKQYNESMN